MISLLSTGINDLSVYTSHNIFFNCIAMLLCDVNAHFLASSLDPRLADVTVQTYREITVEMVIYQWLTVKTLR